MCPSYRVTREEEHSTRGRARLLMEMVRGEVITDGWHSTEVHDALDLCLACKGCRKECPVDVDMATYKAEFLAHHYAGRRPARRALLDGLAARCWPGSPRPRPARGERGRPPAGARPPAQAGRRHRPAPRAAAVRPAAVHAPGTRGAGAAPGRANAVHPVAGHVHQQLPPRGGPGRRGRAGGRRIPGRGAGQDTCAAG